MPRALRKRKARGIPVPSERDPAFGVPQNALPQPQAASENPPASPVKRRVVQNPLLPCARAAPQAASQYHAAGV